MLSHSFVIQTLNYHQRRNGNESLLLTSHEFVVAWKRKKNLPYNIRLRRSKVQHGVFLLPSRFFKIS